MSLNELKKQRAALLDDAKAIEQAAKAKGQEVSAEDFSIIEQKVAEAQSIGEQIKAAEQETQRRANVLQALRAEHGKLDQIGESVTAKLNAAEKVSVRGRWEDDPKKGFPKERDFYMAVMKAGMNPGSAIPENLQHLRAGASEFHRIMATAGSDEQSTFSDPYGGFLIPEGFSPNLLSIPVEMDPLAGRTRRIPMGSQVVEIPARVDEDHTSSVSGGLRVYRRAEADTVSSSRMEVKRVRLEATMLMGLSYATEEILRFSPISVAALLGSGYREEFAARLIRERIRGTGVGEYLGVVNSGCLVTISKEVGQLADTFLGMNILKMRSRCYGYGNAVWLANHDCLPQLAQVHVLGSNGDVFLFNPSRGEGVPDTLLGRPIFFSEDPATVGDAGDLILGNWGEYLEGELQGLESAESVHVRFVNHERTFKFTTMNAGSPWWRAALTPKRSSLTLSPFVIMEART